jgi:hypothetical protein
MSRLYVDLVSSESEQEVESDIEVISVTPRNKRSHQSFSAGAATAPSSKKANTGNSPTAGTKRGPVKKEPVGFGEADVGDEVVELPLPESASVRKTPSSALGLYASSSSSSTPADLASRLGASASIPGAAPVADGGDDDEEIAFLGGNMTVMSEMAHQREACSKFPFRQGGLSSNKEHCSNCFCYVCDAKVAECINWDEHCHATVRLPQWTVLKARLDRIPGVLEELIPDRRAREAYVRKFGSLAAEHRSIDDFLEGRTRYENRCPWEYLGSYCYGIGRDADSVVRSVVGALDMSLSSPVGPDNIQVAIALLCSGLAVRPDGVLQEYDQLHKHTMRVLTSGHGSPQALRLLYRCLRKTQLATSSFLAEIVSLDLVGSPFDWMFSAAIFPDALLGLERRSLFTYIDLCSRIAAGKASDCSAVVRSDSIVVLLTGLLDAPLLLTRLFAAFLVLLNSSTITTFGAKVEQIVASVGTDRRLFSNDMDYFKGGSSAVNSLADWAMPVGNRSLGSRSAYVLFHKLVMRHKVCLWTVTQFLPCVEARCQMGLGRPIREEPDMFPMVFFRDDSGLEHWSAQLLGEAAKAADPDHKILVSNVRVFHLCACYSFVDGFAQTVLGISTPVVTEDLNTVTEMRHLLRYMICLIYELGCTELLHSPIRAFYVQPSNPVGLEPASEIMWTLARLDSRIKGRYFDAVDAAGWQNVKISMDTFAQPGMLMSSRIRPWLLQACVRSFWGEQVPLLLAGTDKAIPNGSFHWVETLGAHVDGLDCGEDAWVTRFTLSYWSNKLVDESELDVLKDCPSFGVLFYVNVLMKCVDKALLALHDRSKWIKMIPGVVIWLHNYMKSSAFGLDKSEHDIPATAGSGNVGQAAWQTWLSVIRKVCPATREEYGRYYSRYPDLLHTRNCFAKLDVMTLRVVYGEPMLTPEQLRHCNSVAVYNEVAASVRCLARVDLSEAAMQNLATTFKRMSTHHSITDLVMSTFRNDPELFARMKTRSLQSLCSIAVTSLYPELVGFALGSTDTITLHPTTAELRNKNAICTELKGVSITSFGMTPAAWPAVQGSGWQGPGADVRASLARDVAKAVSASKSLSDHDRLCLLAMVGSEDDMEKAWAKASLAHARNETQLACVRIHAPTPVSYVKKKCMRKLCTEVGVSFECARCSGALYCSFDCLMAEYDQHEHTCADRDKPELRNVHFKLALQAECIFNSVFSAGDVYGAVKRVLPVVPLVDLSLLPHQTPRFHNFLIQLSAALQQLDRGALCERTRLCVDIVAMLCAPDLENVEKVVGHISAMRVSTDACKRPLEDASVEKEVAWVEATHQKVVNWIQAAHENLKTDLATIAPSPSTSTSTAAGTSCARAKVANEVLFMLATRYGLGAARLSNLLQDMEAQFFPTAPYAAAGPHRVLPGPENDPMPHIEGLYRLALEGKEFTQPALCSLVSLLLLSPQSPLVHAISGVSVDGSEDAFYSTGVVHVRRARVRAMLSIEDLRRAAQAAATLGHLGCTRDSGSRDRVKTSTRRELLDMMCMNDLVSLLEFILDPTIDRYDAMTRGCPPETTTTTSTSASAVAARLVADADDMEPLSYLLVPRLLAQVVFYAVVFKPTEPLFCYAACHSHDLDVLVRTLDDVSVEVAARFLPYIVQNCDEALLRLPMNNYTLLGLGAAEPVVQPATPLTWAVFQDSAFVLQNSLLSGLLLCMDRVGPSLLETQLCERLASKLFGAECVVEREAAICCLQLATSFTLDTVTKCAQIKSVVAAGGLLSGLLGIATPRSPASCEMCPAPPAWSFETVITACFMRAVCTRSIARLLALFEVYMSLVHRVVVRRVTNINGQPAHVVGGPLAIDVPADMWGICADELWLRVGAVSRSSKIAEDACLVVTSVLSTCTMSGVAAPLSVVTNAVKFLLVGCKRGKNEEFSTWSDLMEQAVSRGSPDPTNIAQMVTLCHAVNAYCQRSAGPTAFGFISNIENLLHPAAPESGKLSDERAYDAAMAMVSADAQGMLPVWSHAVLEHCARSTVWGQQRFGVSGAILSLSIALFQNVGSLTNRESGLRLVRHLLTIYQHPRFYAGAFVHRVVQRLNGYSPNPVPPTVLDRSVLLTAVAPEVPPEVITFCPRVAEVVGMVAHFYEEIFPTFLTEVMGHNLSGRCFACVLQQLMHDRVYQLHYGKGSHAGVAPAVKVDNLTGGHVTDEVKQLLGQVSIAFIERLSTVMQTTVRASERNNLVEMFRFIRELYFSWVVGDDRTYIDRRRSDWYEFSNDVMRTVNAKASLKKALIPYTAATVA